MNSKEVLRLQTELSSLKDKFHEAKEEMDRSTKELQREQTKSKSVAKHAQVGLDYILCTCDFNVFVSLLKLSLDAYAPTF